MTAQQNHAPLGWRQCGHIVLVIVRKSGWVENYYRCAHPSGPHPMHEGCPWHQPRREGAQ